MTGETDLRRMLATMAPELDPCDYVYLSFPDAIYGEHAELEPIAACRETEGLTLVAPRDRAKRLGLACEPTFRRLTLKLHSSLEAVGLTAAFAEALAGQGISANVVAGFYHDHILVPAWQATAAMAALQALAHSADENLASPATPAGQP